MSKKNSAVRRRATVAAGAFVLLGAGSVLAAPIASAFEAYPSPGGATVILNHGESQAVHNANLGPVIDAVLPGWENKHGESTGERFESQTGIAAGYPGAQTQIVVNGVPQDPGIYIGAFVYR